MALGGGTFTSQNKGLPGTYTNVISAARADANLSERGIAAMPYVGDWGAEGEVVTVHKEDFARSSRALFGYESTAPALTMFREAYRNARTLRVYRLNSGAKQAACKYGKARYGGTRGNALTLVVSAVVDEDAYEVATLLEGITIDAQIVQTAAELRDNDFILFDRSAALEATAGLPLTGGDNGTGRTGESYQKCLSAFEPYSFHALCCNTDEKAITDLFIAYAKRMRDEMGVKFQTVVYRAEYADHEGVISVENKIRDYDPEHAGDFSLVYWAAGAAAGCAVNASNLNKVYDGEYTVDVSYTQRELADGLKAGKFMLHQVGDVVRVLDDINTLTTYTVEKGADFSSNQTVRVLDQIAVDTATLFNGQYLGRVPNDNAGRIGLWNDIVKLHQRLQDIRAIEDFSPDDVTVEAGESKKAVVVSDHVTPVNAMAQLYQTIIVE